MSDMERNYFYLFEFLDEVVDIREQYPLLPLEDTLAIAMELGITHPRDPKTNDLIVMTMDFMVTIYQKISFASIVLIKLYYKSTLGGLF